MHKIMKIEGMTCGHCAQRVESLLNEMENVSASVYLEQDAADIEAGEGVTDETLRAVVENAGFQVTSIE
ncbi:heavy-metal-associated domain-containing protein [Christensenella intestinihominis]|uniref:heavy-metal-associated domain-containing protein n=1 Tax=Christensenella intestinihominis TaxID=1851429 RepID=UPI00082CBD8B|nr:heavy metal-associated domain-containing protein [Christensenella intestinihominis]